MSCWFAGLIFLLVWRWTEGSYNIPKGFCSGRIKRLILVLFIFRDAAYIAKSESLHLFGDPILGCERSVMWDLQPQSSGLPTTSCQQKATTVWFEPLGYFAHLHEPVHSCSSSSHSGKHRLFTSYSSHYIPLLSMENASYDNDDFYRSSLGEEKGMPLLCST